MFSSLFYIFGGIGLKKKARKQLLLRSLLYVNSNVYVDDKDNHPNNNKNYFTPYQIIEKTFKDEAGKDVTLKIGVIGFVPPQIITWDKSNLSGKVIAKDIIETAKKIRFRNERKRC